MIDALIDKLTNSIDEVATGQSLESDISRATLAELRRLSKKWNFDWRREAAEREVYKLIAPQVGSMIQGLMSLDRMEDHVHVNLLESHPQNVRRGKKYEGIPGNLMAHAAKLSCELGFGGALSFDAKSALIDYYEKTLGARRVGSSQRMVIEEPEAQRLMEQYFGGRDGNHS